MEIITNTLGPFGPVILLGVLGLVLVLSVIPLMLKDKNDPLNKLKQNDPRKAAQNKDAMLRNTKKNATLDKYAHFLEPKSAEEMSAVKMRLMQAGYNGRDAVRYYYFLQFALGLGLLALGLVYFLTVIGKDDATTQQMVMYILGPGGVGYMLPKYWVTRRVASRKEEIQDGFPDALDMMLVCIEAGQSMDQALLRVSGELRSSYPALAEEFAIVTHEMKAGKDKANVLNDMAERVGVQDVSSFVTVLVQSQTFGTPVSDALRVYASEMRDKRVMRAEEKANKLPTKMTLTTMMFTVPPLLIILVGPSVVSIADMGSIGN